MSQFPAGDVRVLIFLGPAWNASVLSLLLLQVAELPV